MLWGVLMVFLLLLFVIGVSFVWVLVVFYFLMIGVVWKCVIFVVFCVGVIGFVDNLLCLIFVGKDMKMFDWVVLILMFGGMVLFGINGFVIGLFVVVLFMVSWDIYVCFE